MRIARNRFTLSSIEGQRCLEALLLAYGLTGQTVRTDEESGKAQEICQLCSIATNGTLFTTCSHLV
jgi:hypothetical protein